MVPSHKQENRKREKAFCASGLESFSPDPELVIYDQIVTDYKMLTGKPNAGAPPLPLLTIIFFIFYFCFCPCYACTFYNTVFYISEVIVVLLNGTIKAKLISDIIYEFLSPHVRNCFAYFLLLLGFVWETSSHIAQIGLELTIWPKVTLNFYTSCLHPLLELQV